MTNKEAKFLLAKARETVTKNPKVRFGLADTKRIMRAALFLLPSKELNPGWYLTFADSGKYVYGGMSLQGRDVRYCPKGLFGTVIGIRTLKSWVKGYWYDRIDRASVEYLDHLEGVAFAERNRLLNEPSNVFLSTYSKERRESILKSVYRAVVREA